MKFRLLFTLVCIGAAFCSCQKNEAVPGGKAVKNANEPMYSTMAGQTIESLVSHADKYSMTILEPVADELDITIAYVSPAGAGDEQWCYTGDGNAVGMNVDVPNDGNTYWQVFFDPATPPLKMEGGGTKGLDCNCTGEGSPATKCAAGWNNNADIKITCVGSCIDYGGGTSNCEDSNNESGWIILQAVQVTVNGTQYN